MLRLRRWVADPRIEIYAVDITPFLAYWPPEHLGGSGVLATVTAGLYISWNGLQLISAATRLQGIFFWGFSDLPRRRHGLPGRRDCRRAR